MKEITIGNVENNYKVYINNTMDKLSLVLSQYKIKNSDKLFLITDSKISNIYKSQIENFASKHNCIVYEMPEGEENKNYNTVEGIYKFLLENHACRDSVLIAFGGGVVGDLVGFTASTFMRGLRFINIPTTLISQVDSCVGGKVGYNFSSVKNGIGGFYNPIFVYIAVDFLKTLDKKQYINGLSEVIKYGVIEQNTIIKFIKENYNDILEIDNEKLIYIVEQCLLIKSNTIEKDFNDRDYRNTLNFGHSVGHAIEAVSEYKVGHGTAVALGMLVAIKLSIKLFKVNSELYDEIEDLFIKVGLPTRYKVDNYDLFLYSIKHDKKNSDNIINMVLLQELGICKTKVQVTSEDIIKAFEASIGR
jgi:3-dehydroquinate synthase